MLLGQRIPVGGAALGLNCTVFLKSFFLIPIKPVVGASRGHSGRGRMVAPLLCTEWTTSSWGCGALPSFFVDRGAVAAAERAKHKGFARGIKMY